MSKTVQKGGTVCGPAPQNQSDVVELRPRPSTSDGGAGNQSVPEIVQNDDRSDHPLASALAGLSNALKSQSHLETRVEKIRSSLLIAGEAVPTLDQSDLSMLQEAYLNASTAFSVAADKALIWQHRVNRLNAQQSTNADGDEEWPLAA